MRAGGSRRKQGRGDEEERENWEEGERKEVKEQDWGNGSERETWFGEKKEEEQG